MRIVWLLVMLAGLLLVAQVESDAMLAAAGLVLAAAGTTGLCWRRRP